MASKGEKKGPRLREIIEILILLVFCGVLASLLHFQLTILPKTDPPQVTQHAGIQSQTLIARARPTAPLTATTVTKSLVIKDEAGGPNLDAAKHLPAGWVSEGARVIINQYPHNPLFEVARPFDKGTTKRILRHPASKTAFCLIPKNSSTNWIKTMYMLITGSYVERNSYSYIRKMTGPEALDSTWTGVVVLRDPLERFLSAYKNWCVEFLHTSVLHRNHCIGFKDSDPSFQEFVDYVYEAKVLKDLHFKPQFKFAGMAFKSFRYVLQMSTWTHHLRELHQQQQQELQRSHTSTKASPEETTLWGVFLKSFSGTPVETEAAASSPSPALSPLVSSGHIDIKWEQMNQPSYSEQMRVLVQERGLSTEIFFKANRMPLQPVTQEAEYALEAKRLKTLRNFYTKDTVKKVLSLYQKDYEDLYMPVPFWAQQKLSE